MKRILLNVAILIMLVFSSQFVTSAAQAQSRNGASAYGVYFEETFFPKYVNKNDTTSITSSPGVADETGLGYDTRTTLGYMFFDQSFLVGLTYNDYTLKTKRRNVAGGDPGLKQSTIENQFGPTLGWLNGGFRILLTTFMSGEKSVETINFDQTGNTANATITNKGLKGFQLTVGYTFALWGIEIGPSLVYRTISYAKQSNKDKLTPSNNYSNVSLFSKSIDNELNPMLSIVTRF